MSQFWRPEIAPDIEPNAVKMARGSLTDGSRGNRAINLKMYYPGNEALRALPIIVWSHGLGGSIDGAAFISRYMAANGYIVLHVQHPGTDSSLWEGKTGHAWDIIRATPIPRSDTIARFVDVPFVLDNLSDWLAQNYPHVLVQADMGNIAMSGHSLGSLTTQVLLGQRFFDGDGLLQDYSDPRFKCGILYSPIPEFRITGDLPFDIYCTIKRPLFHMTGTDDSSPVEGFEYQRRLEVYDNSPSERYMLILNDGDHMIYNGSRGKLGQNPNRELHETIVKMASLAYWEAQLKGDKVAQEWLTGGGFATYLNGHGEFKFNI
jgi:hypothetical protein